MLLINLSDPSAKYSSIRFGHTLSHLCCQSSKIMENYSKLRDKSVSEGGCLGYLIAFECQTLDRFVAKKCLQTAHMQSWEMFVTFKKSNLKFCFFATSTIVMHQSSIV